MLYFLLFVCISYLDMFSFFPYCYPNFECCCNEVNSSHFWLTKGNILNCVLFLLTFSYTSRAIFGKHFFHLPNQIRSSKQISHSHRHTHTCCYDISYRILNKRKKILFPLFEHKLNKFATFTIMSFHVHSFVSSFQYICMRQVATKEMMTWHMSKIHGSDFCMFQAKSIYQRTKINIFKIFFSHSFSTPLLALADTLFSCVNWTAVHTYFSQLTCKR